MIRNNLGEGRQVLPRWRSIRESVASGEMNAARSKHQNPRWPDIASKAKAQTDSDFDKSKLLWSLSSDVAVAEELLTAALVTQRENDPEVLTAAVAVSAAPQTRGAMRAFAEQIIHGIENNTTEILPRKRAKIFAEIQKRKRFLRINPHDGLLVAETALLHANLGQPKKSKKLLERALRTAPNDRYILRAAVRFYCHDGEPDRALDTIRKSRRLHFDPWLRAAELATCALLDQSPRDWRKAKALVDGGHFSNISISELATQIGTFELDAGSRKQALRILRRGAECPTENAVAQIEHVGRETSSFIPEEIISDLSASHEATAHAAYWNSDWENALSACELWHNVEPFSTRPAIFASFVASVRSTSLERGLALGKLALEANPGDPTLLNNIAVIQAYLGEFEGARTSLAQVKISTDDDSKVTNLASSGLLAIRSGDIETGITNYTDAIDLAVKNKSYIAALRAYCFLGRELSEGQPEVAKLVSESVDGTIEKMRRAGYSIPRDVIVLRSQYDELKPKGFGPLSQLSLNLVPRVDFPE